MKRIDTPTAEVDKFGGGKNGFKGGVTATQLDPTWFDSVQEEIARVIENQGVALDELNLGQLSEVLDDYTFADPEVTGTLTIANGGDINIESGGALTADVGSTCTLNGDVLIGGLGSLTVNCDADFMNDVIVGDGAGDLFTVNATTVCNASVTLGAGAFLGAQEIEGGVGSVVDVETVQATSLQLDDADTILDVTKGAIRRNDTFFAGGQGSFVRAIDDSSKGYDPSHTTVNAIDDTDATTTRDIQENEVVIVLMIWSYSVNQNATDVPFRPRITGPLGTVEPDIDVFRNDVANANYPAIRTFGWKPTDDFAETDTEAYLFEVRLGTGAGTLSAENIAIFVFPATEAP